MVNGPEDPVEVLLGKEAWGLQLVTIKLVTHFCRTSNRTEVLNETITNKYNRQ